MDHTIEIEIPLHSEDQATAVYRALDPDPEVKPQELTKKLHVSGSNLKVNFAAKSDRSLRVSVNGFMDSLREVLECLSEFYPAYYYKQ